MLNTDELEARIEEHVSRTEYRPSKPNVIAKQLKIVEEQRREFKHAVKRMIKKGRISWGAKHLIVQRS